MTVIQHFPGLLKAVGQVLIVVDGHGAPIRLEDLYALLEELVARIENLFLLVTGVVAVLGDDQDGIHGKVIAAAAQSLGNRGVHGKAELAAAVRALVTFGLLVYVERDDLHIRPVPAPFVGIAYQEAIRKVLSVRQVSVDGGDDGDAFGRRVSCHFAAFSIDSLVNYND